MYIDVFSAFSHLRLRQMARHKQPFRHPLPPPLLPTLASSVVSDESRHFSEYQALNLCALNNKLTSNWNYIPELLIFISSKRVHFQSSSPFVRSRAPTTFRAIALQNDDAFVTVDFARDDHKKCVCVHVRARERQSDMAWKWKRRRKSENHVFT